MDGFKPISCTPLESHQKGRFDVTTTLDVSSSLTPLAMQLLQSSCCLSKDVSLEWKESSMLYYFQLKGIICDGKIFIFWDMGLGNQIA